MLTKGSFERLMNFDSWLKLVTIAYLFRIWNFLSIKHYTPALAASEFCCAWCRQEGARGKVVLSYLG